MSVKKNAEGHDRPSSGDEVNPVQSEAKEAALATASTSAASETEEAASAASAKLVKNPKANPLLEAVMIDGKEYRAGSVVTDAEYQQVSKHKDSRNRQYFLKRGA